MLPLTSSCPPHTPHGSWRSRARARQAMASEHFEQIALARATSMRSSEKNRWVRVPLPSLHRARFQSTAPTASARSGRRSCVMLTVVLLCRYSMDVARTGFRRKNQEGRRDFDPDGLFDLPDVVFRLRRVPTKPAGGGV